MQTFNIKGLDEMSNLMGQFPMNKLVFWIGAGIDHGKPTALPLGGDLTNYILKQTCGEKAVDIIKMWRETCHLFKMIVGEEFEFAESPRLETVIEVARKFEEHQINKQSVIEGIKSFTSKEFLYNNEHLLLAQCLHKGANIVTTNYGDFICKAYEEEYGEGQINHENNDVHLYRVNNEWSSCIYHIHGIADDLKSIGTNLSTVKNSLPKSFREKFKYWLDNDYVFVFMGYGGGDTLDINPFFQMFRNVKGTFGIYIRHTDTEDFGSASSREKTLLCPFENKYICPCITKEFFQLLDGYVEMKKQNVIKEEKSWQEIFSKYATSYDKDSSIVFVSALCYNLGFSISKLLNKKNWLPMTLRSENIVTEYKLYHAFQNAFLIGNRRIIKTQGKLLRNKSNELMESDYQVAVGKAHKAVNNPNEFTLQEIKGKVANNEVIDWSFSTNLNRYIEYNFFNLIKDNLFFTYVDKAKDETVIVAKQCFEVIISGGYDCVTNVNQINTAYRSLALCQSILSENIDDIIANLNIALKNYADISSVNGVAMTLLYKAMVYLVDYNCNKFSKSLKEASGILLQVYRIFEECELKKYYKRYLIAKIWYITLKLKSICTKSCSRKSRR